MYTPFPPPHTRRDTDSLKWRLFPGDVLPLWVADMDFAAPEPVLEALRARGVGFSIDDFGFIFYFLDLLPFL